MSKVAIEGNALGTGTLTIAAPNTNTNRTLTLPDDTGTIVTNSGNQAGSFTTLNTSGQVVFNDAGADVDFRVEGDGNANLIVADAGVDKVGIGTNTFNTNGGVLQVSNGISFPATQSACADVNTLDDYEEGTWTPTVIGTTTAGVGVYSKQVGRYIKIGKLVLVQAQIQWSAHTGTGNLQTVLPFAVVSVNDAAFIPSIVTIDLTLTANNLAAGVFEAFSSSFNYYQMPTGGGAVTGISMDTSARVVWSGVYETN